MVSVPGSSIDNAAVDGRGGLELRKSGGRAAPAPPAAAPSTSGGEGQGTDAASMIINSEMEALRRQRMLAAAYEAQELGKKRMEEQEMRRQRFLAESARRRQEEANKRKNKNIDFFRRIFDVKHHASVLISPLPPAVKYSLTKQFTFLTSIFTMFLDKDGVSNARRAIYGQRKQNSAPQQRQGRRIVKKQVVKRIKKKKKSISEATDAIDTNSYLDASSQSNQNLTVDESSSSSSGAGGPSMAAS